ncbi:hypothetical protein R3P38DRAFT_3569295, partial [Favolaschia claudopus]
HLSLLPPPHSPSPPLPSPATPSPSLPHHQPFQAHTCMHTFCTGNLAAGRQKRPSRLKPAGFPQASQAPQLVEDAPRSGAVYLRVYRNASRERGFRVSPRLNLPILSYGVFFFGSRTPRRIPDIFGNSIFRRPASDVGERDDPKLPASAVVSFSKSKVKIQNLISRRPPSADFVQATFRLCLKSSRQREPCANQIDSQVRPPHFESYRAACSDFTASSKSQLCLNTADLADFRGTKSTSPSTTQTDRGKRHAEGPKIQFFSPGLSESKQRHTFERGIKLQGSLTDEDFQDPFEVDVTRGDGTGF